MAYQLRDYLAQHQDSTEAELKTYIKQDLIEKGLGVRDVTDKEIVSLIDHSDPWPASYIFADIISRRAQSGWSTHGHSGSSSCYVEITFTALTFEQLRMSTFIPLTLGMPGI